MSSTRTESLSGGDRLSLQAYVNRPWLPGSTQQAVGRCPSVRTYFGKGAFISDCCQAGDYDEVFTPRAAAKRAARFRRRGLTGSAQIVVATLTRLGPGRMSLLEVGGGVGEIQIALLENGAAGTSINVDLSSNWEAAALDLISERSLRGRVTRITGDFVREASELPKADAVILHRVVCCYPDWQGMLIAAASRADRFVAVTFPRPRPWFRGIVTLENAFNRLRRSAFRAFIHPPEGMVDLLRSLGFPTVADHQDLVWRTVVAERQAY